MPNWCDTTYKCVGDSNEVKELYNVLERLNNSKEKKDLNGFGSVFLDELITGLGYNYEEYPYPSRGRITSYEYNNEMLTIYQETAWSEQEGVRIAIEERFPSIKVYYLDEEYGNDHFYTNDKSGNFFPERYVIDGEDVEEYFESIEDVSKFVNDMYGLTTTPDFEEIEMQINEYVEGYDDEDFCLNIHEIVRVD